MGRRLSENEIGLEARTFISWKFDWNKGIIWNFASRHVCNSTKVCWPVVKIISTPPPFKMEFSAGIESIFPRSRARIIKSIVTYGANGISRAWLSFASRFTITGTLTRGLAAWHSCAKCTGGSRPSTTARGLGHGSHVADCETRFRYIPISIPKWLGRVRRRGHV